MSKPTTTDSLARAFSRLKAYAEPRRKTLLLIEDNEAERLSIAALLGHDDIDITSVGSGAEALSVLKQAPADCVVLDLSLPDMSGFGSARKRFATMERSQKFPSLYSPAVNFPRRKMHSCTRWPAVLSSRAWNRRSDCWTRRRCSSTELSPTCPKPSRQCLRYCIDPTRISSEKTVLLVDDDARNIFALSSVLERRGMTVLTATTGIEAIEVINMDPAVAIVLMDIMMPGMDGYETMQVIRSDPKFRRLPIVALTAKAMKGDREKCLEAGASDYLAKPVNTEQLLSALRMWLHR